MKTFSSSFVNFGFGGVDAPRPLFKNVNADKLAYLESSLLVSFYINTYNIIKTILFAFFPPEDSLERKLVDLNNISK
jgi:hypothetical protein